MAQINKFHNNVISKSILYFALTHKNYFYKKENNNNVRHHSSHASPGPSKIVYSTFLSVKQQRSLKCSIHHNYVPIQLGDCRYPRKRVSNLEEKIKAIPRKKKDDFKTEWRKRETEMTKEPALLAGKTACRLQKGFVIGTWRPRKSILSGNSFSQRVLA